MHQHLTVTLLLAFFAPLTVAQCPKRADNCVTVSGPNPNGNGTVETTTYDNSAHAQAVGRAVSAATFSTLHYFLIDRPEIERRLNERVNRREGRFAPAYENLDMLASVTVPSAPVASVADHPTLKGYYLGESWQDFLSASPLLSARVSKCSEMARSKSGDHRKKMISFDPCSVVPSLNNASSDAITFNCLESIYRPGKDMICQDFTGEVTFAAGKLVAMKAVISDDWTNVEAELRSRFGEPNAQNKDGSFAVWNTADLHMVATSVESGSAVSWMDSERYVRAAKVGAEVLTAMRQTDGNSLDR